jgi:hypothetical protein
MMRRTSNTGPAIVRERGAAALRAALLVLAMVHATPAAASALGDTASSMAPGEWRQLPAQFLPSPRAFFHHSANALNHVIQYANNGVWDPARRRMLFVGEGHGNVGAGRSKMIQYDEATDRWTASESIPAPINQILHAYDHNVFDPTRGVFYTAQYYTRDIYAYDVATGTWSALPQLPPVGITKGMTYFPEMDALIVVDSANEAVHALRHGASSWTTLGTRVYYANYHPFAEYDPVRRVVYFGGGNSSPRSLFELSASGAIRPLASPPPGINLDLGNAGGDIVADPVSGHLIVRVQESGAMAEYAPASNSWALLPGGSPSVLQGMESIAIPIATYGVIMYVAYRDGAASVWLYKHRTSRAPVDPPPAAPTGLRVR